MDQAAGSNEQGAELVARIRKGDAAAEGELYRQYARGLLLMLTQRCGDPELAADLQQEAFIVVLRRLREEGISNPEQIRSFIWATASNLFINDYRKAKRRNTWTDSDRFDHMADEEEGIVERLEAEEAADKVRRMIRSLPVERDRELLYRFYIDGEEKPSICQSLELDAHHFDRVIYRAKQRLKQLYMVEGDGAGASGAGTGGE